MSEVADPREVLSEHLGILTTIPMSLDDNPSPDDCKLIGKNMANSLKIMNQQLQILSKYDLVEDGSVKAKNKDVEKKSRFSFKLPNLNPFSSPPKKTIQIMDPVKTKTTRSFSSYLEKYVQEYDCSSLQGDADLRIPLIIVCPNSSRLKPDVDHALEKVKFKLPSPTVMIILHAGDERNIPSLPSGTKLGGGYPNIKFVDMGFEEYAGIHNCQKNQDARVFLGNYIEGFYKSMKEQSSPV